MIVFSSRLATRALRPPGILRLVVMAALFVSVGRLFSAEVLPEKPARYFNDYAHVVSSQTAEKLNQQLENFERETTSQIVVAVYPKMQSESSIDDFTFRTAQSWGVGQKGTNNGAVLFVF